MITFKQAYGLGPSKSQAKSFLEGYTKYDPDQPRDDQGQWASEGGNTGGVSDGVLSRGDVDQALASVKTAWAKKLSFLQRPKRSLVYADLYNASLELVALDKAATALHREAATLSVTPEWRTPDELQNRIDAADRRVLAGKSQLRTAIKGWLSLITKYDSDQPRDEDGKWTEGGGDLSSAGDVAEAKTFESNMAQRWSEESNWEDDQHAARAIASGMPRKDYICYDCLGDDVERYDRVNRLIDHIEKGPVIDKPLYRGLHGVKADQFKVGQRFSESLASWTGNKELAGSFATGKYRPSYSQGESAVLSLMEANQAKGFNLSKYIPEHGKDGVDEWLTSGEYEIAHVQSQGGILHVSVKRIGPVSGKNLRKWDTRTREGSLSINHKHRLRLLGVKVALLLAKYTKHTS